jgi:hypothetical protein
MNMAVSDPANQTPPHGICCHPSKIEFRQHLIDLSIEHFPVFFPRPVPASVSYVSAAFSPKRHAAFALCIFSPGIILGRL